MYKKIFGSLLLMGLISILTYNLIEQVYLSKNHNEESGLKDSHIVPPNSDIGLDVGEKAPEFELETIDGEKVSLSDFRGKKVFLNFWASWCGPCRTEMPEMDNFQREHGDEVEIIAVNATGSASESIDKVRRFLNQGDFSFTVLLDHDSEVTEQYRILGLPTTYFIGTDGYIQEQYMAGPMTFEYMEEINNKMN